jgi:hypothetical protein
MSADTIVERIEALQRKHSDKISGIDMRFELESRRR